MDNIDQVTPSEYQDKSNAYETRKQENPVSSLQLIKEFHAYILTYEKRPNSVFAFCDFMKIEEKEFYNHFSSLNKLEQEIWKSYFHETVTRLHSEDIYKEYSVREKLLAFFYTFLEVLKKDRSYILKTLGSNPLPLPRWRPSFLNLFQAAYFDFVNALIEEGKESGEVAERFLISCQYKQGLWAELLFVLNFWVRDESLGFEQTDAAIEKSVNLTMDLMGRTALDSLADFAKFLYKSWK